MNVILMRIRVIFDDGTPRCLPKWARDEIVHHRLATVRAVEALQDGDPVRAVRELGTHEITAKYIGKIFYEHYKRIRQSNQRS